MPTAFDRLLRIGPIFIQLHVEAPDPSWSLAHLERRLLPFAFDGEPGDEVVHVDLRHPHALGPLDSAHLDSRLTATRGPDGLRLRRWDVDLRSADHRAWSGDVAPTVAAIDTALLVAWFVRVVVEASPRGLLVHAASTVHDGEAWLFPAMSGTGKSTLARLSPGERVLSDEITLLTERDGRWWAWPSPFWNAERAFSMDTRVHEPVPVAHIALLEQAKQATRFTASPFEEVLVGVLQQTVRFDLEMATEEALLTAVMDLLASLPPDRIGRLALLLGDDPYRLATPEALP